MEWNDRLFARKNSHIYKEIYYSSNDDRIWILFLKFLNGSWSRQISSFDHYLTSWQVIILHGWRQISLARWEIIDSCAIQIRSSRGRWVLIIAVSAITSSITNSTRNFSRRWLQISAPFVDVRLEIRTEFEERGVLTATINHGSRARSKLKYAPRRIAIIVRRRWPPDTIGERVPVREARANFAAAATALGQLSRFLARRYCGTWLREFRSPVNIIRDTGHDS